MKKACSLFLSFLLLALPLSACDSKIGEELLPEGSENDTDEVAFEEQPFTTLTTPSETESESSEATEEPTEEPTGSEEEAEPILPTTQSPANYIKVLCDGLTIRTGAGTNYRALGTVEKGVLLHFEGKVGNWYQTYYRGQIAYVSALTQYTSIETLPKGSATVEAIITEGLRLLGVPYVYGAVRLHDGTGSFLKGFTTEQFDCSSLMQYIFYRGGGVLLDTTTRTQVKQGSSVQELQRGDLLFFTNASRYNKTGIERVGHVALYLGGNYILHTSSDYAKIEQISSTRWGYFLCARRIVNG